MKYGLINRHILMEQLQKKCMDSDTVDFHRGLLEAQAIVMKLPDENDRPEGKWRKKDIHTLGVGYYYDYECSVCKSTYEGEYKFCPNCGAKMCKEAEND